MRRERNEPPPPDGAKAPPGAGTDAEALGNEPEHGGRVILVGVDVTRDAIPTVSASEAAERLGVSRPRVTQMLASGALVGWRDGRNTRVTVDSVNARLEYRDYEREMATA